MFPGEPEPGDFCAGESTVSLVSPFWRIQNNQKCFRQRLKNSYSGSYSLFLQKFYERMGARRWKKLYRCMGHAFAPRRFSLKVQVMLQSPKTWPELGQIMNFSCPLGNQFVINPCCSITPLLQCRICSDLIWGIGRQGFKCVYCKTVLHKKCSK